MRTHDSQARFVLMLAGSQGGKTAFGPIWMDGEIQRTAKRGEENAYIAVTTTFDLFQLKMLPAMREWFEQVRRIGKYWPSARVIEICDPVTRKFSAKRADDPMYAKIILRSVGAPSGLEALTAKAGWGDELGQDEWDVTDWEAIQRRLAVNQGRFLGTTTPYNMGWLKTEWYDRWAAGDHDYDVIQFESTMNPAFPPEEFERLRRTLPEWRFEMFFRGRFMRPAGLIYGSFEEWMLEDQPVIPIWWKHVVGVDFGGSNTALLWLAEDPATEIWHVYREWVGGGVSTPEHVARVREQDSEEIREGMIVYVGGAGSETQERMDWTAAGLEVDEPPLTGSVESGITRVIELIRTGKLRVSRSCTGLLHELQTYRRKLDTAGNPTDVIVEKRTFHRLDALRYAVSRILEPAGRALSKGANPLEGYRG